MRHIVPALAAVVSIICACHSYEPVAAERQLAPRATIRVTFAPARDIAFERDSAGSLTLHDVGWIQGRVAEVRGDTLRVLVQDARDSRGRGLAGLSVAPNQAISGRAPAPIGTTRLVPDSNDSVEVRELQSQRTFWLTVGGAALALIAALAIWIATGPPLM